MSYISNKKQIVADYFKKEEDPYTKKILSEVLIKMLSPFELQVWNVISGIPEGIYYYQLSLSARLQLRDLRPVCARLMQYGLVRPEGNRAHRKLVPTI